PAQPPQAGWSCASTLLDNQLALWREGTPSQANALADAFIRDLAAIRQSRDIPIIVAAWNIEARCPPLAPKRSALVGPMGARIERAGLQFLDLDQRIVEKAGPAGVAKLHGFGASFGTGHLNVEGNRVYGEIFADVLRPALFAQP